MPAVSDADILKLLAKGEIAIAPFRDANLTPNGYDVTIAEVAVPSLGARETSGTALVPPQTRFAVGTEEVLELGPGIAAGLWIRTTWGRRGVLASFGVIDSGFKGTLTLPAFNASHEALALPIGERFAQVVFLVLSSPSDKGYEKRSGHYQGQTGVRLS